LPLPQTRQLLEESADLLRLGRHLPSLHNVAMVVAERDRDLPCVLIDSEVQQGWFSCRVTGRTSDTSPYPMGEPLLLHCHSFIDSKARKGHQAGMIRSRRNLANRSRNERGVGW